MDVSEKGGRLAWAVIAIGLLLELAIGVAGIAVAWMLNKENLLNTFLRGAAADKIAIGAGLGLAAALLIWIAVRMVRAFQRSRSMRILVVLSRATWLQAALLCVVAAVAEEFLFRGALQPDIGIWATAVLFGLLHAYGKLYVAVAMLAGVGLGFLYQTTGSLAAAVAAHASYNLAVAALIKLGLFPLSRPNEAEGNEVAESATEAV